MILRRRPGLRRGAGQALVEFVIGATLFLIPIFLIIPLLGKYADMKSSVVQAARFNAWERTVWYQQSASSEGDWPGYDPATNSKSTAQLQTEMTTRFLTNSLWRDRAGMTMVAGTANNIENLESPGAVNTVLGFIVGLIGMIGDFSLEFDGLYRGTATLTTASITPIGVVTGEVAGMQTWENLNLSISDRNAILANGWGANGPSHVESQVKGLLPTALLSNTAFDIVRWLLVPFAPELVPTVLEFGKVEVDEVPDDRLQ